MKLTTDQQPLAEWLQRAAAVADERSPATAFHCVRLDATASALTISAGNQLFNLTTAGLPLLAAEPGSVSTPAARIAALIASLRPNAAVEISFDQTASAEDNRLRIKSGRTNVALQGLDPLALPVFTHEFPETQIRVIASELDRILTFTMPAMEVASTRPALWGMSLSYEATEEGGRAVGAASDGRVGAVCYIHAEATEFPAVILPRPLCQKLHSFLKGDTSEIEIAITGRAIRLKTAAWTIMSSLVDAIPPPYKQWMPPLVAQPVTLDSAELASILARLQISTDMDNPKLRQHGAVLNCADQMLRLRDGSHSFEDVMSAVCERDAQIGVNALHIGEALSVIAAEQVELHFVDRYSPIRICAAGATEDAFVTMAYSIN
jgi:DNA polymerase-3 subunit beta